MRRALCLALVVAGCTTSSPDGPASDPIPFKLDARGVQLLDRDQRIDFGRTDHSAEPAMSKLVGLPPASRRPCAGGGELVVWPDGTGLVFAGGAFRGWVSAAQGAGAGRSCAPLGT